MLFRSTQMQHTSFLSHNASIPGTVRKLAMTFLRALLFVFLLAVPRVALAAGSVSIGTLVQWVDKSGNVLTRDVNTQKTATLGDCNSDYALQFPLTFSTDYSNQTSTTQIWVGGSDADCTLVASRGGTTQTCWKATAADPVKGADSATISVNVRVQDIMSQDKTKQNAYVAATAASACKPYPGAPSLTIYFMTFAQGGTVGSIGASYPLTLDTSGPTPPSNLVAGAGNRRLYLTFTPPSESGQNIAFTNVYCALSPVNVAPKDAGATDSATDSATSVDAATSDDASTTDASSSAGDASLAVDASSTVDAGDGGSTIDASTTASGGAGLNCALSSALVPGEQVPAKLPAGVWICASETASSSIMPSSVMVTKGPDGGPLANGTNYTMAVAFVDTVGNAGLLSERICATPEATLGFYDQYAAAAAGGQASGCALSPGGGGSVAGLILLGLVLAAVRRSR